MSRLSRYIKRDWRLIVTIATFVALGLLIYALRQQIFDTVNNLGKVNSWALLLVLVTQAGSYYANTKMYQSFFKVLGYRLPFKTLLKATLELNFVNNVFPSGGVSGISYYGIRMKSFGVSTSAATLAQIMKFGLLFISFQILMAIGLLLLAAEGKANSLMILIAGSLATLVFIITVGAGFILGSRRRINTFFTYITKVVNRVIQLVRPKHPETINIARVQRGFTELHENFMLIKSKYKELKRPLLYALLANFTEVLTIYVVYIAFGEWVNIGAVIIAYAIANIAGLISVLPGGVGIYEALMTTVLVTAGVPAAVSIPVTVMYRVINMTLQLPVGYFFYHRAIREQPDANAHAIR